MLQSVVGVTSEFRHEIIRIATYLITWWVTQSTEEIDKTNYKPVDSVSWECFRGLNEFTFTYVSVQIYLADNTILLHRP